MEKKTFQFGVRFDERMMELLKTVSAQTGMPLAELVRLCVDRQLEQIARDGGITLPVDLGSGAAEPVVKSSRGGSARK